MSWIKATGKVQYSPPRPNGKKRINPWWIVVNVDHQISYYYRQLIYNEVINPFRQDPIPHRIAPPMWGTHITVLPGREEVKPQYRRFWKKYDGQVIDFEYNPEGLTLDWKFWHLPVRSEFIDMMRTELGFERHNKQKRLYPLHITVGRMD